MKMSAHLWLHRGIARLLAITNIWMWSTVLLSLFVCGLVSWLHFQQQESLRLATVNLENMRLARIDLSKGFLYASLAGAPGSPFDREQGLALLQQAISSLDDSLSGLGPESKDSIIAFRESVGEFQAALGEWNATSTNQPALTADLRIAFSDLERQTDRIDRLNQQSLKALADRLNIDFAAVLAIATILLSGVCGLVYVTGRAKEESDAALKESELKFREMFEHAPVGVAQIEIISGRYIQANPHYCYITGLTFEEISQAVFSALTHPEDLLDDFSNLRRLMAGEISWLTSQKRILKKDGEIVWVNQTISPMLTKGKHSGNFIAVIDDITGLKQAESAIAASERRFRGLAESIQDYIMLYDSQCRYVYENHAALRAFGFSEADVIGKTPREAGFSEGLSLVREADVLEVFASGNSSERVFEIENANGKVDLDLRLSPVIGSDGNVELVVGISRDITALKQAEQALKSAYEATLQGWSNALELRERETAGHAKRVVYLTIELARALGIAADDLVHIQRGTLLHDIGKMGIPDSILLKPGPLTDDEWVVMRQHPLYAYQLLSNIPYLAPALEIPYYHHERWDGSGYPQGLSGEAIPLAARIFAVVDVWDALSNPRPYRPSWPKETILKYLQDHAGHHFDPKVVEEFIRLIGLGPG